LRHLRLVPSLVLLLPLLSSLSSHAAEWQQPTPEELKMTADPSAPDAEAVYLYREEITDNHLHMQSTYVRLKILRDEGKKYGDVEISGYSQDYQITDVQGRTIHSDGTVVPFTGKPYEKLLFKTKTNQYKAKVFSLPDVEAGSILEYRYKMRLDDNRFMTPEWEVQTPLFTRKAHFHFVPTDKLVISHTDKGSITSSLAYSKMLPPGADVVDVRNEYDLNVSNVRGLPREEFEPPMQAFAYRVRFYYTSKRSVQEYWDEYGKSWSKRVDKFAEPSPAITSAAQEFTSGAKTEDEKLQKLYNAVMKLENTRFTREHSEDENRAEGVKKVKSAADVLSLKRGSGEDIALLFLALVRAGGFKAYAMQVTNRDRTFFQPNYLDSGQLDDTVVIVMVGGKEKLFDPGERYAGYAQLHWKHAQASGLRQHDGKTDIGTTPSNTYKETIIQRIASLKLAADGAITGDVSILCTGVQALRWRQKALQGDEVALKKEFDDELASDLPPGIVLHTDHFLGLADQDATLMVRMAVAGSLGTATGKRVFLPVSVFAGGSRNPFTSSHREEPVDLRFPYVEKDEVTLHLPAGFEVETLPQKAKVELPQMALYLTEISAADQTITFKRTFIIANVLYMADEYGKLKGFFDDVSEKDRAQAVLHPAPAAHVGQ
jgi:transglutaminase-like putative cysteine protease